MYHLCAPLRILQIIDIVSDLIFLASSILLYLAVKYTSISRFNRFTYIIVILVVVRTSYAVYILILDEITGDDTQ